MSTAPVGGMKGQEVVAHDHDGAGEGASQHLYRQDVAAMAVRGQNVVQALTVAPRHLRLGREALLLTAPAFTQIRCERQQL